MSTATAEAPEAVVQEEIPEPIPKRSDVTKVVRIAALNRVAHMGMMIERTYRNLRAAERLQRFAQTNDPKDLEAPEGEDEDMGVNIGNETHYHITQAPQPVMATQPQSPAPAPSPQTEPAPTPPVPTTAAPAPAPEQTPAVAPTNTQTTSTRTEVIREKVVGYIGPALLTAGALVVGAAGTGLYNWYMDKPEHVTNIEAPEVIPAPETNWKIGLEVEDYP